MTRRFIPIGALLAGLAVILGAFGAHALEDRLEVRFLDIYDTGVWYLTVHALGLIFIGMLRERREESRALLVAGILHIVGILLFSGSLVLLALSGLTWLGAITPFGGTAFIAGWIALAWGSLGSKEARA